MVNLNIETGVNEYDLNGSIKVWFNPTDGAFVERLFNTFDALDKKQEHYKDKAAKMSSRVEIFDFAREMDSEMREAIDGALEAPICEAVFGKMNVYALADGLPVWCNLMLAIMDETDTAFSREQKATNPRIQKYTAKYHR